MIPPIYDESEFPVRLRQLLALEVSRIVEDMDNRRVLLIEAWSRHRDRGPFVDTLYTRWRTLDFSDLATLSTEMIVALESFFRELDDVTMYFRFTEDMPTTLADVYDDSLRRLTAYASIAIEALGGAPKRPMVEFHDDPEEAHEAPVDVIEE